MKVEEERIDSAESREKGELRVRKPYRKMYLESLGDVRTVVLAGSLGIQDSANPGALKR